MKKIVLLVAFLFLLVGCSELEMDSPTKKVETFLNKYQTHDSEIINEFDVTMFEEENLTEEQKERYKEIMLNQYKDLIYKIKSFSLYPASINHPLTSSIIVSISLIPFLDKEGQKYINLPSFLIFFKNNSLA